MKCPSPAGAVPAANAAAAGGTRLPPARPPAQVGAGAGSAPARPLPLRARPGSGRGAAVRLFVRGAEERRDAGQAASRSSPLSSGPEAEKGAPGLRRAPLSAAPGPAPFCMGACRGGRGTQLQPPAPTLFLRPGSGAGVPGECPPSARGGMAGPGRFVCPGNPGTARRAGGRRWARARGLGQASRGDARQGRPPGTGGTDRSAGQWGWGQLAHLRGEETRSLGGRSGFGLPAVWFTRKECNHLAACGPWTCPEGGKEAFRIGLRFNLGWEAGRIFRALGAVVCENKELQSTHKS